MSHAQIKLKYAFRKEIRMLTVKSDITHAELVSQLQTSTKQMSKSEGSCSSKLMLRYIDDDLIILWDESDWRQCVDYYNEELLPSGQKLKLFIEYENSTETLLEQLPPTWALVPTTFRGGSVRPNSNKTEATIDQNTTIKQGTPPTPVDQIRGWVKGNMIGTGASSEVFFGMDKHTAKFFAAKQTPIDKRNPDHTEKIRALQKEIELMSKHQHENIVRYLGSEIKAGVFSIFIEYVPGGSIASLLFRFGSFHEKVIRVYTRQILLGLHFLHANGIIHRDIKGGNILVSDKGQVKVADFGCSKKVAVDSTGTQTLLGTALWMAPEVIKFARYGESSDIWSVGCTVVEMATGKPPWTMDNSFETEIQAMYHIAKSGTHPRIPSHLSRNAKDFLRSTFSADNVMRSSAAQLLKHSFITEECVDISDIGKSPTTTITGKDDISSDEVTEDRNSSIVTSMATLNWEESSGEQPRSQSLRWGNVTRTPDMSLVSNIPPLASSGDLSEETVAAPYAAVVPSSSLNVSISNSVVSYNNVTCEDDTKSNDPSTSSGVVRDESVLLDYLSENAMMHMVGGTSSSNKTVLRDSSSLRSFPSRLSELAAEQVQQMAAFPVGKPTKTSSPRRTTSISKKSKKSAVSSSAPSVRTAAAHKGKTRASMPLIPQSSEEPAPTRPTGRRQSQSGSGRNLMSARRHQQFEYSEMLIDAQALSSDLPPES